MFSQVKIVGLSPAVSKLRGRIGKLAPSPAPVLIRGETGSGKELCAQALHEASGRRGEFVALNCGAIPANLVEGELFGSEAGAYTGARQREGLLRRANKGTLFLDEIGELPPAAQAVLLRVLETGEVRPVGGGVVERVDLRVISATHRPLNEMVRGRCFRADLYHRLATLRLEVPPLRRRRADVRPLAAAMLPKERRGLARLQPEAWLALESHPWPGNVRELRNVLLRTLTEHDRGPIHARQLLFDPEPAGEPKLTAWLSLRQHTAGYVQEVVSAMGSVRGAARVLQISPMTVYRHLAVGEE